jgi:hypothetical protein
VRSHDVTGGRTRSCEDSGRDNSADGVMGLGSNAAGRGVEKCGGFSYAYLKCFGPVVCDRSGHR